MNLAYYNRVTMRKISNRLTITFGLLISSAIFICGWYFYGQTEHHLERELGERLVDIAQTIATLSDGEIIRQLVPGNETGLTYRNLLSRMNRIRQGTDVSRIYIFDRHHRSLADTEASIPIGTEYLKLRFDQVELGQVWGKKGAASVLFRGEDGNYYKSGYAPILVGDEVVAAVGVDASAAFLQILKRFGRNVLTFGAACIIVCAAIVFIVSKRITNPIHRLVAAVEMISSGDLEAGITIDSNDEIGFLGKAMEQMRVNIIKRDGQMRLMLANVAHEIRNPLGGIELFSGILSEELGHGEDPLVHGSSAGSARAHLEKITTEVHNLNQIIAEFLDFARPREPRKADVYLHELIQSAYCMLALEFEKARVEFQSRIDPLLTIHVDGEQFKRVFINLFKNSLQALQNSRVADGRVMVRSGIRDGMVEVSVEDNGPGIPHENMTRIFEPFFTTKEKGAGLGLAIIHKIVTDHGGRIEIRSTEGASTAVIIRLVCPA
ncbi:MAG: ATP-binding protein [bacterium]